MVVITCVVSADNGAGQYLSDVSLSWWNLQKKDEYTDVVLVSGQFQVRVHREILLRVSSFLHSLVPPSCSCDTPAITLPTVREDTLKALVELAYTGRSKIESRKAKEEFEELTQFLQIRLEIEYQEIVSQERVDHGIRANQVASVIVKTAGGKVTGADEKKESEEKAETNIYEQRATADKSKNEEELKGYADKKKKEKEKTTDEATETEFIAALGLNRNIEKKTAAFHKKEENKMAAPKKVKNTVLEEMPRESENVVVNSERKQSANSVEMCKVGTSLPGKVGGSPRLTRGRTRSTVQESQCISSPSPIGQRRKTEKADNILAKTPRNQKRKIQTFQNVSDEIDRQVITEPKRQKLDLIVRAMEEESSRFINIQDIIVDNIAETDVNENNNGVVQDPIKIHFSDNLETSILSDEGDKDEKFVCLFCKIEFQKKSRYDYHLSWNHFRGEIADKFPGLKCVVCAKSFIKKSNYVSHMGSFHKIMDGFMKMAQIREDKMAQIREDKMTQIREAKLHQPFASPQDKRKDDSWLETIKQRNTSTPNEKRLTSSKESDESIDMDTPCSVVAMPTPRSAIDNGSIEDEADGNRDKVETIEDIQAFINELPKSNL